MGCQLLRFMMLGGASLMKNTRKLIVINFSEGYNNDVGDYEVGHIKKVIQTQYSLSYMRYNVLVPI